VKKVWEDNGTGRPENILVQLFADGTACGQPVNLSAENGWKYTWENLPKNRNDAGLTGTQKAIAYTVEEVAVPEGYEATVTGSQETGFIVTNTLKKGELVLEKIFEIDEVEPVPTPEDAIISIPVKKIWVDNDNKDGNRPGSITVHLYAGGVEVASAELNEGNGWTTTFADLPKYTDETFEHEITYTVTEDPVEWYKAEISGFTITNTYQPEVTSVSVKKIWDDEDNKRQRRPLSIHMTLNNGMVVVLNEENNWSATITNLPTKINGEPFTYAWTEQSVIGYTLEKVEQVGSTMIFTNKIWERPEVPEGQKPPKTPGDTWYVFEEYETPLGVEVMINHVGDCFD